MSVNLVPTIPDFGQVTSFPQMRKLVESMRAIDGLFTDGVTIKVDAQGRIYAANTGAAVVTWDSITGKPVLLTLAEAQALFQPMSGNLFAIAALSGAGIIVRINPTDWATRTIEGVADRIAVADGDGVAANPVIDIAATYAGQTSIVTVGTITAGEWQATVIATQFGGTGMDNSALVADRFLYTSATGVFSAATVTAFIRTLMAAVDAAAARTVLDAEQAGAAAAAIAAHETTFDHANLPTDDEKDALAGTDGTPSAANPYVTDSDPRLTGGGGGSGSLKHTFALMGA